MSEITFSIKEVGDLITFLARYIDKHEYRPIKGEVGVLTEIIVEGFEKYLLEGISQVENF